MNAENIPLSNSKICKQNPNLIKFNKQKNNKDLLRNLN